MQVKDLTRKENVTSYDQGYNINMLHIAAIDNGYISVRQNDGSVIEIQKQLEIKMVCFVSLVTLILGNIQTILLKKQVELISKC